MAQGVAAGQADGVVDGPDVARVRELSDALEAAQGKRDLNARREPLDYEIDVFP